MKTLHDNSVLKEDGCLDFMINQLIDSLIVRILYFKDYGLVLIEIHGLV